MYEKAHELSVSLASKRLAVIRENQEVFSPPDFLHPEVRVSRHLLVAVYPEEQAE